MTDSTESLPLTLTPAQAAAMVPMGLDQFYRAVRAGIIPSLRMGRSIKIPRKKFIAYLEGEDLPKEAA